MYNNIKSTKIVSLFSQKYTNYDYLILKYTKNMPYRVLERVMDKIIDQVKNARK